MNMINKLQIHLFIIFIMSYLLACQSTQISYLNNKHKSNAPLTNTYWKLLKVNTIKIKITEDKREAYIQLKHDGNFKGYARCNIFNGQYTVKSNYNAQYHDLQNELYFNNVSTAKLRCIEGMKQENTILAMMDQIHHYKISGDNLLFYNKENKNIAHLIAVYF
ncbi:META domain-containing protein [Pseudoalteromonas denitrificans]|uniref:Heat shock protein HslJ n=1 Tax=Pseudoalteromonas denitrificans DSM 6059 TaxID=1123010 RepID=A0A1I1DZ82_9GAMM|nr:META domain-containing protein [Pseudoalteromonas denitrificans]SFB80369.1 Heat shock protein HslJ [Pseudoalteromonas denitrificans DSM 6059]